MLTSSQIKLVSSMKSGWSWRMFQLFKLPSLGFWGVKIKLLDTEECLVTMPFGWRTQNPFQSVYFAAQCGAAELSTGALALLHLDGKSRCSMLVTAFESKFYKKATDTLSFECSSGNSIAAAIDATMEDGEGKTVVAHSKATLPDGTVASEFWVTWSFRRK